MGIVMPAILRRFCVSAELSAAGLCVELTMGVPLVDIPLSYLHLFTKARRCLKELISTNNKRRQKLFLKTAGEEKATAFIDSVFVLSPPLPLKQPMKECDTLQTGKVNHLWEGEKERRTSDSADWSTEEKKQNENELSNGERDREGEKAKTSARDSEAGPMGKRVLPPRPLLG